jgi:hypothetical protein
MNKRSSFGLKYVNVPTNNFSSWSASSRTIFNSRANIEERKVSVITIRSSKTNSFQKTRTEFIIKIKLNKEQCINNNNNPVQFFVVYMPSQQLQGQLQKQHNVDTISRALMLIVTSQRKKNIKTAATRSVSERTQWRNWYLYLTQQRKT